MRKRSRGFVQLIEARGGGVGGGTRWPMRPLVAGSKSMQADCRTPATPAADGASRLWQAAWTQQQGVAGARCLHGSAGTDATACRAGAAKPAQGAPLTISISPTSPAESQARSDHLRIAAARMPGYCLARVPRISPPGLA